MPTDTSVKPTAAPKRKRTAKVKPGKFLNGKVEVNSKFVTIRLPASVAEYLEVTDGKQVYYTLINGVVQISVNEPSLVIPSLNLDNSGFLPQT